MPHLVIQLRIDNVGPDTLTRAFCVSVIETNSNLCKIYNVLVHPGVARMLHFARVKNLLYSTEEKRLFFLQNMF